VFVFNGVLLIIGVAICCVVLKGVGVGAITGVKVKSGNFSSVLVAIVALVAIKSVGVAVLLLLLTLLLLLAVVDVEIFTLEIVGVLTLLEFIALPQLIKAKHSKTHAHCLNLTPNIKISPPF
jgi:hypothetical protein